MKTYIFAAARQRGNDTVYSYMKLYQLINQKLKTAWILLPRNKTVLRQDGRSLCLKNAS